MHHLSNDGLQFASTIADRNVLHSAVRSRENAVTADFKHGDAVCIMNSARRTQRPVCLSAEAQRAGLAVDNAGGSSVVSEAFSMEFFMRCARATSIVAEMNVRYWCRYKMVDYVARLPGGVNVGVSVTRAFNYADAADYTEDDAVRLLAKKLHGIVVARNCVVDSWFSAVLHIFCQTQASADMLKAAFQTSEFAAYHGDVVLMLTVCSDFDEIFSDDVSVFAMA